MVKRTPKSKTQKTQTAPTVEHEEPEQQYKEPKTRIEKKEAAIKELTNPTNTGVIYVGHLPWGFDDVGLKKYFSQFGEITRIIAPRSKRTGRSVGYAFIEFADMETAAVAAKTMNNYILFDRILKCNVVEDKSKYDRIFLKWKKKFKFVDQFKKNVIKQNKPKTKEEIKNKIQILLNREEQRRNKFEEMGIDYDFPGFKEIVERFKKGIKTNKNKNHKNNNNNNSNNENAKENEKMNKKVESVKKKEKNKKKK
jgi:nucleolar protein 15